MPEPARQKRIIPAPLLVAACLAAGWAGTHFAPRHFLPDVGILGPLVAALLVAIALGLGLAGLREFSRNGTPSSPYKPTATIVTRGIFRFTRNPMYLSFLLIGLGAAIGANSVWFLASTVVLALLLQFLVIEPEERYLSDTFGKSYDDYRKSTGRWL